MKRDIDDLRDEIARLKRKIEKYSEEEIDDAKTKMKEYAHEFKEEARDKWETTEDARRKAMHYIKEHPWTWAVAGLLVGMGIGSAAKKRKRWEE